MFGCRQMAFKGKMLCRNCLLKAAGEKEAERADMAQLIRQMVKESLQDLSTIISQPGGEQQRPDLGPGNKHP